MATVTGLTKTRMLAIEAASVISGAIDVYGHLILTTHGGTTIDAGYVLGSLPDATTTVRGIVELATSAETSALTDSIRAITPAGISALISGINTTTSGHTTDISNLNTTVGGHTTTLASHDSSITSLNSTTGSHTSTLSSHTSSLSNHETRIGNLEGIVNDTGWVNLGGYVSGYTATAEPVQYRYKNNVMYLRGGVTGTYTAGVYQQVINDGTIPSAYRTAVTQRGGAAGTGLRPGGFEITVAGGIKLGSTGLSTQPGWIAFATSYPV